MATSPLSDRASGRITVVIPTLQRSPRLGPLVDSLLQQHCVHEIIVINNGTAPISWMSDRVRVISPGRNIYVNAAWNVGVAHAKTDVVALLNDDISVDETFLPFAVHLLDSRHVGLVGPDVGCFSPGRVARRARRILKRPYGFGTAMVMRRTDYVPIPEDGAKIWFGDDWLQLSQRHMSIAVSGPKLQTEMSTTAASPEFADITADDYAWWSNAQRSLIGSHGWHFWWRIGLRLRTIVQRRRAVTRQEAGSASVRTALWVIPVAELGGVARHALDSARVGVPGWRIVVLCPSGPLADALRQQGSAVFSTDNFGPRAGVLKSTRTLRRAVSTLRPAIVHSHLSYADIITAATRLPPNSRRVSTEHGIAGDDLVYHHSRLQAYVMAIVHRLRVRRVDELIAVSEATRRVMERRWRPKRPITVIPNGVDTARLPPKSAASTPGREHKVPLRLLSLSRLAPEKRLPLLLRAFAAIHAQDTRARLTVAGEGPLRADLELLAGLLGISDAVRFPGHIDPLSALDEADIVVQLSLWENCSYTLLDALARGVPVAASDVGGNGEIVPASMLIHETHPRKVADGILLAARQFPAALPAGVREMTSAIAHVYGAATAHLGGRS